LTVSGHGWTAGDTIFVQIGSSTFDTDVVCALTASSDGTIAGTQPNGNCTVPNVPAGSRSLVAIDEQNQSLTATGTSFTVKPVLVLTPANSAAGAPASPGVTVTVQGHGFAAGSTVTGFKFDGVALTTTPTSVSTDGSGSFSSSVTFTVPSATTAGTHTVVAHDTPSNSASTSVKVYAPRFAVSPVAGAPGRGLTVSGGGWPAGDTIFLQIGSATFDSDVACTLLASSDGTIAGTASGNNCKVPNVPKGTQPLVAIDEQNQGVLKASTFAVSPVLVLTPANSGAGAPASPGVTVTVQGHGFVGGSTVTGFKFDGVAVTAVPSSVSTDGNGNFSSPVTFTVPSTATAGNHTVAAHDSASNAGSSSLRVYVPHVTVSPASGAPGRGLTVSGGGWPVGDTIFLQIGSSTFDSDVACTLVASSDGTIAGTQAGNSCQVPNVPKGTQPLVAIDDQNQGVVKSGTFAVSPVLVLTPAGSSAGGPASPGATVTVTGHGFAAGSTVSGFKFDGVAVTTVPSSVSTDGSGNFSASVSFTVPSTTVGNHTVVAHDSSSNSGSSSLVVYVPHISVSPVSGVPGHGLTVSGNGWPAGDTIFVQIGSSTFDSDVVCVLTASSDGTIAGNQPNGSCAVPSVATGSQPLVAIDDQHQGVIANGSAFTVT
jgi:hypothetical protein